MSIDTSEEDIATIVRAIRERSAEFDHDYWYGCEREQRFPAEFVDAMAVGGWLGLTIPEQYGGGDQGHVVASAVLEEIAGSGAGLNGCVPVHMTMFATEAIVRFGTEEQKSRYLPAVCAGSKRLCFAVTEADAGSDSSRIRTRARRNDDGWVISGQKTWITLAHIADWVMILARTGDANADDRFGGLSLFLADLDPEHVRAVPIPKFPHNAVGSCELFIDDLPVAEDRLVGTEGQGFRQILASFNSERVLMAAEMVGIGRAALDHAIRYAKDRVVFGRAIGTNQAISHPLARAHCQLSAASALVRVAGQRLDDGLPAGAEANEAKYLAAEAAYAAADAAMQTLGGMAFALEFHVERLFRDARLCRVAPVSQEMTLNYVAQSILGLPRSY